ncbi:MAG TPA: ROK family protein [Steroidobacteraceae bacterium]|nr:ROK family protein [Steroidobacteraceae bacterium]
MTASPRLVAGVELGGTKCVCVLGTGPDDVRAQERLATTDPATTLARIESVLGNWVAQHGVIAALGVASFGPLALRKEQPAYGSIVATTKPGWSHTDIVNRFADRFGVPVGFDTDVNGAALAEGRWGAARGLRNFAYVTVGTGIGVGLIVNGAPVLGCNHTEMGHIRIVRKAGDVWPGICAFHGDCVEGLASGPAIEARAGTSADRLGADHAVWPYVAHTLGQLLHAMVLTTAPERILLGGGVMTAQSHLFERVREELRRSLNRYVEADEVAAGLSRYVTAPGLGTQAGPLGALALALDAVGSRGD